MKTPLLLLLLLLLGGCGLFRTQQPPADKPLSWQAQREKNRSLEHFQISGKIGIRAPRESGSANLFWQQSEDYFDIRLSGPLGRGAARLTGNLQQARLEAANDISEGAAQTLLSERLSLELPLDALHWWLRGLPAPGKTARLELDSNNRLAQLNQQGWQIDYPSYRLEQGYWLPERLKISGHNLLVTLVIKDWNLAPPSPLPQPLSHQWERGADCALLCSPRPLAGEGSGERVALSQAVR